MKKGVIFIENDKQITLSIVKSRFDEKCTVSTMMLSEFYSRLATPVRSTETLAQYLSAPKSKRDNLKDVGGFIGGKMFNGIRKAGYVEFRDLITLDMDSIPAGQTDTAVNKLLSLGISVCVYSTRKHRPDAPRLRAVLPLNRSVTADEYEPVARKVAQIIAPDMLCYDRTTFDVSRIMYWPSVSSDSQYVYKWGDGGFIDVDAILKMYCDWRNFSEWPKCPTEDISHAPASKQEDPLAKKGIVGAFCRVYSIKEAIDKFIPGVYVPAGENRYTYSRGSTTGGAIVYDNKYLYSHHATDPACDTLCNAFDLIRIHLYGQLDESAKEGTPTHKLPSFAKMKELAIADATVNMQMRTEKAAEVYEDFAEVGAVAQDPDSSVKPTTAADNIKAVTAWMAMLKVDGNNTYVKSYENVLIALENDPQLKGRFYMNTFTKRPMAIAPLPWGNRKVENTAFEWTDADDDGLLIYIEKLIGIRTKTLVTSALNECWAQHPFHPVKDYLSRLNWDGIPRLESVFQTYLGAEDNAYVRAVTKMIFVAAVTRIYFPGTKFDTAVVFVGPQGLGKTAFISTMAKCSEWYTDNIQTLDRSAIENIQGTWLVELGELAALKKNEIEEIKSFMSRQADRARLSYGKYAVTLPRTCVFFGTTNTYSFLKDSTGDRRFYPVDVGVVPQQKSVMYDLPNEVDQIWAEALYYYKLKTPIILSPEMLTYAKNIQEDHYERSEKQGLIEDFLSKPVPVDWDEYSLDRRLLFYADTATKHDNLVPRTRVCAMEIWCECLGGKKEFFKSSTAWEINAILRKIPGWISVNVPRKFPLYGSQRGFRRDDST